MRAAVRRARSNEASKCGYICETRPRAAATKRSQRFTRTRAHRPAPAISCGSSHPTNRTIVLLVSGRHRLPSNLSRVIPRPTSAAAMRAAAPVSSLCHGRPSARVAQCRSVPRYLHAPRQLCLPLAALRPDALRWYPPPPPACIRPWRPVSRGPASNVALCSGSGSLRAGSRVRVSHSGEPDQ